MKFAVSALALIAFFAPFSHAASNFDDLSKRAAAALDQRPEEAASLYRQALALRPDWAEGWFYLGASLYESNHYDEARNAFHRTLTLAGSNGVAWAFLGLCDAKLDDRAQALADISKGEALGLGDNQPFVSTVRVQDALLLTRSSSFEQAMEQLWPLAKAGDQSPPVIEAYGLSSLGMARLPSEVPADKKPLVTLAGQAAWAFFAQRPAESKSLFEKLVTTYPNEPGVHYAYGVSLATSDPQAALAQFRQELQTDPAHLFARLQIAILEIKNGEPERALEPAQEAVKKAPNNALAHVALGRALLDLGQPAKALPELETGAKLAPANPQTHLYLEQVYRRLGRKEDAQKQKAEFVRLRAQQDPLSMPEGATGAVPRS